MQKPLIIPLKNGFAFYAKPFFYTLAVVKISSDCNSLSVKKEVIIRSMAANSHATGLARHAAIKPNDETNANTTRVLAISSPTPAIMGRKL